MGPCTRRSRRGRTAVASARCSWPGRAAAPLLPGCDMCSQRLPHHQSAMRCVLGDNCLPRLRPVNRRHGSARVPGRPGSVRGGRLLEGAGHRDACNGVSERDHGLLACRPGRLAASRLNQKAHAPNGRPGPLRPPLWRYRKGPGVICLPRAQTGNDHHERTLTRDTRPIRLHGAVSPWQRGADRGTAPVTMGEFS